MKTAEELFHAAFSGVRVLRSNEYKLGVLSHLEYKLGEKPECKCPYEEGSAAFDAFWSGITESWLILEKYETVAEPANGRADLPPTKARQPRSGTEGAIGG